MTSIDRKKQRSKFSKMSKEEQLEAVAVCAYKDAAKEGEEERACKQAALDAIKREIRTLIEVGKAVPAPAKIMEGIASDSAEPLANCEWRKKGPILMADGKIISHYGVSDDKILVIEEEYERKMKSFAKIVRGLFTGDQFRDPEYIAFCDNALNAHIKDESANFIKVASREIVNCIESDKVKAINSHTPTAPDTPWIGKSPFWGKEIEEVAELIDITDDVNKCGQGVGMLTDDVVLKIKKKARRKNG